MQNLKGLNNIDTAKITREDIFHSHKSGLFQIEEERGVESLPSKLQSLWDVFLLLIAYLCMGGFLALTLLKDFVSYLIG